MYKLSKVFLLALSMNAASFAVAEEGSQSTTALNPGRAIVNGHDARNIFPTYTYIEPIINNKTFICGATLIAPRWLVTAAHCLIDFDSVPLTQASGFSTIEVGRWKTGVYKYKANSDKFFLFSPLDDYWKGLDGRDIALVHLTTPIDPSIKGLSLVPLSIKRPAVGEKVTAVGFGRTKDKPTPPILQEGQIEIVDNYQYCHNEATFTEVCVGNPGQITDFTYTAKGDSGGPTFVMSGPTGEDAPAFQRGVISRFVDPTNPKYGIDTDVSAPENLEWIQRIVETFASEPAEQNAKVTYTCYFQELYAGETYNLTNCEADGEWGTIAPYLAATSERNGGYKGTCYYSPLYLSMKNGFLCTDPKTPIYHYWSYFSRPEDIGGGKYRTKATIPLTKLGTTR
ncbi:S1 family peptidase [Brucella sp. IR073]|uniref:S1 family peptidase n=1 Tax=unclassified Brucella TaxID=2632610 RepID=UPI003B98699F